MTEMKRPNLCDFRFRGSEGVPTRLLSSWFVPQVPPRLPAPVRTPIGLERLSAMGRRPTLTGASWRFTLRLALTSSKPGFCRPKQGRPGIQPCQLYYGTRVKCPQCRVCQRVRLYFLWRASLIESLIGLPGVILGLGCSDASGVLQNNR